MLSNGFRITWINLIGAITVFCSSWRSLRPSGVASILFVPLPFLSPITYDYLNRKKRLPKPCVTFGIWEHEGDVNNNSHRRVCFTVLYMSGVFYHNVIHGSGCTNSDFRYSLFCTIYIISKYRYLIKYCLILPTRTPIACTSIKAMSCISELSIEITTSKSDSSTQHRWWLE